MRCSIERCAGVAIYPMVTEGGFGMSATIIKARDIFCLLLRDERGMNYGDNNV